MADSDEQKRLRKRLEARLKLPDSLLPRLIHVLLLLACYGHHGAAATPIAAAAAASSASASSTNITQLLESVWLKSSQSVISIPKQIYSPAFADKVSPAASLQRRLDWLDAIAQLCERGYEGPRIDSKNNYDAVFTMTQTAGGARQPRIPKVVHQIWKTVDISTHSPDAVVCTKILKVYASDYYQILWTDLEIFEVIKRFYSTYLPYYLKLNMNIKRADIARYLILQKYGGVYVDLDIEFLAPVANLVSPSTPDAALTFISYISKEFELNGKLFAGNAFFACIPKSSILRDVLKHSFGFRDQKVRDVEGVLRHTGPMGLGDVVAKFLKMPNQGGEKIEAIRIHNSSVVGNVEDKPSGAVHRRKHKWN